MQIQAMHVGQCWHNGRGPVLQQVHYDQSGVLLTAADYITPDGVVWHLLIIKPQVFMFTPEEVENYASSLVNWSDTGKAALICLGRSPWLSSFNPHHLKDCSHFKVVFYDEFLDVICQDVSVQPGRYPGPRSA